MNRLFDKKIKVLICLLATGLLGLLSACGGDGGGGDSDSGPQVIISWNQNPDSVLGYRIYQGDTINTATKQVADISVFRSGFDPTAPSVSYSFNKLGLTPGDEVCIRLKAYNAAGESDYSSGICEEVPM